MVGGILLDRSIGGKGDYGQGRQHFVAFGIASIVSLLLTMQHLTSETACVYEKVHAYHCRNKLATNCGTLRARAEAMQVVLRLPAATQ
jgi:hypothetical protein